ncbi:hypothetical protein HELRODRAFT_109371 [Helobdella robusta]|uniref:Insulin-degrading enzyme n=1 Tax=Helobdella robusta TaxID=6412 RepID=T1EES8_HELRO|nr:hypothetical protein HELRODRAFT_109371 [Helobdella robusta]ESO09969.1 hypothetical protein HELRODRAFT_109371 [Helobdella robusta]
MNPKIKEIVNDITKPDEDNRLYRGIQFKNGLKVLLISDSTTDKSSAALDVNIGNMSDPDELPGLAHFCEHMLFLGTKKYPEENNYNKFLSEHGGSSNAYTSSENTNYYFDVSPDHLTGALDRFAQFFVCPLFTESATSRELNAVNSENDKNIQNDSWRMHQLEKSTFNPKHPYSKFGTGNKETLDIIPRQLGLNVREELLKFHGKFYSSNIMALAVLGKESLDELTTLVTSLFSDVENKNVTVPEWLDHPFGAEQAQTKLTVVPIMDVRSLNITWPTPDLHPYYKSNPGHYLGHLIGHEGPGSLLSELKKRGWVNTLAAGEGEGGKGFMFFSVQVDLTEDGIEHVEDIVSLVFQYLKMLKKEGVKEWIFSECQKLSAMSFRFKDKTKPSDYTSKCASKMQIFPLKEVLSGGYFYDLFKPELIDMVLDKLSPEHLRLCVVGKKFAGTTNVKEKWYGTDYSITKIPKDVIDGWRNIELNERFLLPEVNDFIPTNFELLPITPKSILLPSIIHESNISRIWYCQDSKFKLPKACFTVQIFSSSSYSDPLSANLTFMYGQMLKDILNEYLYAAELSGVKYDLNCNAYGLQISIGGYNDKQQNLLRKIVEKGLQFDVNKQRFDILLENYVRALKNFRAEQPHQHAIYYTSLLISEQQWTKEELLEATEETKFEKLLNFVPQLFGQVFLEAFVYGNVSIEKAKVMVDLIEQALIDTYKTRPLLPSQQRRFREVQLPDGGCYRYCRENDVHKSSSLEIYYQCCPQETHSNMLLELFCQIISEPCYDILRTQEQLGYIVFSGVRRLHGVQGLRIIVQSDRSPAYVEQRIELFMLKMKKYIEEMTEDIFQKHVNAVATKRLEKPKRLAAQNHRYWSEISNQFYNFQRDEVEVSHLKTLTKKDIINFYEEMFASDAPKRHKLSVHVVSTASPSLSPTVDANVDSSPTKSPLSTNVITNGDETDSNIDIKFQPIEDVQSFKRNLGLFPLPVSNLTMYKSKL